MFRLIISTFLTIYSIQVFAATANVDKSGLAVEGFDVVSYFRGEAISQGPIKGDSKFQTKLDGVIYNFATEANKQEFLKNPTKYQPAFGGWCAYAVAAKREKVEVDVKSFLIQDGRLLLFYDGILSDTRKFWTNTPSKSAIQFLKEADANWPEVMKTKP